MPSATVQVATGPIPVDKINCGFVMNVSKSVSVQERAACNAKVWVVCMCPVDG